MAMLPNFKLSAPGPHGQPPAGEEAAPGENAFARLVSLIPESSLLPASDSPTGEPARAGSAECTDAPADEPPIRADDSPIEARGDCVAAAFLPLIELQRSLVVTSRPTELAAETDMEANSSAAAHEIARRFELPSVDTSMHLEAQPLEMSQPAPESAAEPDAEANSSAAKQEIARPFELLSVASLHLQAQPIEAPLLVDDLPPGAPDPKAAPAIAAAAVIASARPAALPLATRPGSSFTGDAEPEPGTDGSGEARPGSPSWTPSVPAARSAAASEPAGQVPPSVALRTHAATVTASVLARPLPSADAPETTLHQQIVPQPSAVQAALHALQPLSPIQQSQPVAPLSARLAEQLMEYQLDLAGDGEWLDRLAQDIARINAKDGVLRFRLNPDHLGSLKVELTQTAQGATIRLTAETEAARAIIAEAQPRLLAEARAQGVRVAEAQVDLGSGDGQAGDRSHRGTQREPFAATTHAAEPDTSTPHGQQRRASERYA